MSRNYPVITSKVQITEGNPKTDHWLSGRVVDYPEYRFVAKVYDVGSCASSKPHLPQKS